MEQGMEPDVKKYFRKVLNSFSFGLLWLMSMVTAGLYFELAYRRDIPVVYNILFYTGFAASLIFLLWYFYRIWKK